MPKRKYTKWTKDGVLEIARQYNTAGDFHDKANDAYMTARRRGWLKEACAHMYSARFVWTEALIVAEAAKYKTRSDFANGCRAAYSAAARKKILDKVCAHMPKYSGKGAKRGPNKRTKPEKTAAEKMAEMMGL